MKKFYFILVALIAIAFLSSCNRIDPIWGTEPVNTSYASNFPLDDFYRLGLIGDTAGQKAIVDQHRKQLTLNVMRNHPCIKDVKNIHFVFGSGSVTDVLSGDGKTYSGKFRNELIIILNDPCAKDTLFLACGNGMLNPIRWKERSSWGYAENCRFEILPGQGLAHHLPALQEWAKTAGDFDIPIKDSKGNIVSQQTYLTTLGKYECVLFPGDIIDMCQEKVFNKAGQEVQFERRLEETKKANSRKKRKA
jgi:hypothetical protein